MKVRLPIIAALLILPLLAACGRQLPSDEELAQMRAERAASVAIAPAADDQNQAATANSDAETATSGANGLNPQAVEQAVAANPGSVSTSTAALIASSNNLTDDTLASLVGLSDTENGAVLYNEATDSGFACADCHTVDSETNTLGPYLYGIPYIAAQRVPGYTAERYLYTSIIASDAHLTPGFPAGLQPQNYLDVYTASEIFDIVAYMLTLDNPDVVGTDVAAAVNNLPTVLAAEATQAEAMVAEADATTENEAETVADAASGQEAETAPPADEETADEETTAAPASDPISTFVSFANANNGAGLFQQMTDTGFSCANCHSPDSDARLVGPGLLGIPQRAAERVPGQSAAQYLYESITNPHAYVVEDYADNLMPANYTEIFNDAQIYDLVAYLLTLSG